MKEKWLEKLREKRDYLKLWLERIKNAQEVVPVVHQTLEQTEWEIDALENAPVEADEITVVDLSDTIDRELHYWKIHVPIPPPYDVKAVSSSSAISTSATACIYEFVSRVGDLETPATVEYSGMYTVSYQELQQKQDRVSEVRRLIDMLGNPQTLERFERALASYHAAESSTGQRTSAAIEMRTLLDGIQGDLFEKARDHPGENMVWSTMAERLTKGEQGGVEEAELRGIQVSRSSLIDRLSRIGKDREGGSVTDLGHIWTQLLDHLYAVLSLVEL